MKTEVNQSKLVGITDIRRQYVNLSPKRIRRFVKLYLDPKLIGNRLFVEREKLEALLSDPDRDRFPLDV